MNKSSVLSQLSQAWKNQADLDRQLRAAKETVRTLTDEALSEIYPEALRQSRFVPLTRTTGVVVHRVEMAPPLTPGREPFWQATGHGVRFRVGNAESTGPVIVEQAQYEALPEDIRALTREGMLEASRAQKLTGLDAPLKLTDRQGSMFSMLAVNNEKLRFSAVPVPGGQRLPSAIWDSSSSTQSIWTAMVKRGVLELASGNLGDPCNTWRVNPGPRFAEAVSMISKRLRTQHPGAPVSEEFDKSFGVGSPSSGSPARRRGM